MKLFLTVVLASVLMIKTAKGEAKATIGDTCVYADDTCPVNAACTGATGAQTCTACMEHYTKPTATDKDCKTANGQACTVVGNCDSGVCDSVLKKCGKGKDVECSLGTECASLNCDDKKCADAGAAGVVTSVLLMVATLMTSRIL
eukprot:TRINITY_DN197_c0_g1_i4.p1 TRINITY_DN197_c0_g1~~TRINITY_DN197_c0_g1_i4.p1  ORF type:complete len:145 (+),score=28.14 TRINITY_DN197_c0_g1_i4:152-586(+)